MKNLKVNKRQPEPLTAQISDESGIVLIAETYGPTCRERADLFVKAVNCHNDLVKTLLRWEEYAQDNLYSENEDDVGFCSFLKETRDLLAKAKGAA